MNGPDISLMTARHQSIKLAADSQQLEHFWLCMCGGNIKHKILYNRKKGVRYS